jgi:hypothetical protein
VECGFGGDGWGCEGCDYEGGLGQCREEAGEFGGGAFLGFLVRAVSGHRASVCTARRRNACSAILSCTWSSSIFHLSLHCLNNTSSVSLLPLADAETCLLSVQVEAEEQSDISDEYEIAAVPLFIWIKVLKFVSLVSSSYVSISSLVYVASHDCACSGWGGR